MDAELHVSRFRRWLHHSSAVTLGTAAFIAMYVIVLGTALLDGYFAPDTSVAAVVGVFVVDAVAFGICLTLSAALIRVAQRDVAGWVTLMAAVLGGTAGWLSLFEFFSHSPMGAGD